MIFLSNVAKFYNGKPLFENVNISVHRGDRIGMVGPNGAGKSTLLGMMEGVITPDAGEISIEKRIRMGVLHQELIQGNDGPILEEVMNISDELRDIRERLSQLEREMAQLSEDSCRRGNCGGRAWPSVARIRALQRLHTGSHGRSRCFRGSDSNLVMNDAAGASFPVVGE